MKIRIEKNFIKQRFVQGLTPVILLILLIAGCGVKSLPHIIYPKAIYPLTVYPMYAESNGLMMAAVPFEPGGDMYRDPMDVSHPKTLLPLNVLEAGVLPIRLIIFNQSQREILLDPNQILGLRDSVSFKTYSPQEAVDLVIQSKTFKKAIKGSEIGPILQSVVGGEFIFEAAKSGVGGFATGGFTGGASGATTGIAELGFKRAKGYKNALIQFISREYLHRALEPQTLFPGFIVDGLVFFPSNVDIRKIQVNGYILDTQKPIEIGIEIAKP